MPFKTLSDGTKIYYDVIGPDLSEPDVLTLVFSHGAPGLVDSRLYEPFWGQFADDKVRVLLYEQRGSGRSDDGDSPEKLNIKQHAADINELRNKLGIEKIAVGGVSQGGYVAIAFAQMFPEKTAALICCNTEAKRDTSIRVEAHKFVLVNYYSKTAEEAVAIAERVAACDAAWTNEAYAEFLPFYAKNAYKPEEIAACEKHPDTWVRFMRDEFPKFDLTFGLDRITCPVLYLVGQYDCVHPPGCAELTIIGMTNAEVTHCVIADTGDPVYRDKPEESAAAVRGFLTTLI